MAGRTVELSSANFEATLKKGGTILLDFWAPWCGPCRVFSPIFERVSEKYPDITFAKINTEAEPELGEAFQIRSIPTVMALRDGVLLFNQPGALPEAALESLITEVQKLDMDAVRKDIAEHAHDHDHSDGHSHDHDHRPGDR